MNNEKEKVRLIKDSLLIVSELAEINLNYLDDDSLLNDLIEKAKRIKKNSLFRL